MIDASPRSPVFDALLDLNPWARPHWERRLDMIEAETWNINAFDQAGNDATRHWKTAFNSDRTSATLMRLGDGSHGDWNAGVFDILSPLFEDASFRDVHPGTPPKPDRFGVLYNFDAQVTGYVLGQFKADLLMLGLAGLHDAELTDSLDISGQTFTIGFRLFGGQPSDILAHEVEFGPYSDISATLKGFDASGSVFYGHAGFVPSSFNGDAIFASTTFMRGASFSGVAFKAASDFSGARFDWDTQFGGTLFSEAAIFAEAEFRDRTTFEFATFHNSADFTGAVFHRSVSTVGIQDKDVVRMILAAKR